jgi:hypothetical protein
LFLAEEGLQSTRHPAILVGQNKAHDRAQVTRQLEELRPLVDGGVSHANWTR